MAGSTLPPPSRCRPRPNFTCPVRAVPLSRPCWPCSSPSSGPWPFSSCCCRVAAQAAQAAPSSARSGSVFGIRFSVVVVVVLPRPQRACLHSESPWPRTTAATYIVLLTESPPAALIITLTLCPCAYIPVCVCVCVHVRVLLCVCVDHLARGQSNYSLAHVRCRCHVVHSGAWPAVA